MDDHFIQSITNLSDNELQCKLNYLTKAIEREKSLNPYSKENALDSELRAVLHEIGNRRAATSQQTLSFGRRNRNKGRNLLMSKTTQTKKKAAAEAAEATRASLKSDVTTVKTQLEPCASLEPNSASIERPTKVSKNNAGNFQASSTSIMSRAKPISEDIDQFMIEERAARRQRDAERESSSKSMSIVTSQSSDGDLARKPDLPLVEPTSTVAKQSNSREGFISHEYLASSKGGRRIMKKIEVHEEAASVLEESKARYQDNAKKQVVSLNTIAMRRNSTGNNPEMNNVLSTLLIIAAGNTKFGAFFDANSLRANQIQNVIAKHNIKRSELRALATTAYNIVKQFRKSKYNQWLKQSQLALNDYGGDHNLLSIILKRLREANVMVVTDGTEINAENAKVKKIYFVSSLLTPGNEDACRQIVHQSNRATMERFDCRNCNNAIANNGGGGQYCLAHIPTHCTIDYQTWKTNRWDNMSNKGRCRIKDKSGNVFNGKEEDWDGCAAKPRPYTKGFFCSNCIEFV